MKSFVWIAETLALIALLAGGFIAADFLREVHILLVAP